MWASSSRRSSGPTTRDAQADAPAATRELGANTSAARGGSAADVTAKQNSASIVKQVLLVRKTGGDQPVK
jgi:hypothetical protein